MLTSLLDGVTALGGAAMISAIGGTAGVGKMPASTGDGVRARISPAGAIM
jgi:hypothetical protein